MDLDTIAADTVRDALRAVRFAKPLRGNPLLDLAAITLRLRAEGVADTPQVREWELGRLLADVVWEHLARVRQQEPSARETLTEERELALLSEDFAEGNIKREAWGMIYVRYLAETPTPVEQLSELLSVVPRTLQRRLELGHQLLAEALREAEIEAAKLVEVFPGAPASARVVVDERAVPREVPAAMAALLEAVRDDERVVHLTPAEVEQVVRYPVADEVDYRLGRIAEWSQPRYQLDSRFVELSLLVDQGEEATAGRWSAQTQRYQDLWDVLEEVKEPALVVLGAPGCGKSTLLRRLELDLAVRGLRAGAEAATPLTLFVQLNQYTAGSPPPGEWLAERWTARYPALPALGQLLAAGRSR